MGAAARLARAGNRLISFIALLLIALMFVYGAYSLWDTWAVYRGAFVSNDLLQFKPSGDSAEAGNPTLAELQQINPGLADGGRHAHRLSGGPGGNGHGVCE